MPQINRTFTFISFLSAFMGLGAVFSQAIAGEGQPTPWQITFQDSVTPIMTQINDFHNILMVVITVITIFVLVLLAYVCIKFRAKANPTPSKTTHHTLIEVVWTVVPVLILIGLAIPSYRLLVAQRVLPVADMTIKAIGNQWYWSYEYPDHGDISFDSVMVEEADLKPGQPRLLAVDNDVVIPVGKTVRVIVTATDVIHNWAMPSFGIKMDGIPGRLNETWFRAEKTGTFYGQCSELCGIRHAFMPIAVRVVSQADFDAWVEKTKSASGARDKTKNFAQLSTSQKITSEKGN